MFYFFHTFIERPKIYTLSLRNYSYIGLLQRNKDNVYDIYIYIYINIMRGKKDVTTFPDKPVS